MKEDSSLLKSWVVCSSSVGYDGYIYHSWYLVSPQTFVEASHWLGREHDDDFQLEWSPSHTRSQGCPADPFSMLPLCQQSTFWWGDTTLLCLIRKVDTWSGHTPGQLILGYICWLLGRYSVYPKEDWEHHRSVIGWRIVLAPNSWVVNIRKLGM